MTVSDEYLEQHRRAQSVSFAPIPRLESAHWFTHADIALVKMDVSDFYNSHKKWNINRKTLLLLGFKFACN